MDLMGVLCFQLLQLMSPLAQGLFHRAISQSGTAIMKVFITPDPLKAAKVGTTPLPGLNNRGEGMEAFLYTHSLYRRLLMWLAATTTTQRSW